MAVKRRSLAKARNAREAAEELARAAFLMGKQAAYDELLLPHKCSPIARVPTQGPGRDWWVGELTERLADWPHETHCFHMKTPLKDVVFGITPNDACHLLVLMRAVYGSPINEKWVEGVLKAAQIAAAPPVAPQRPGGEEATTA